MLASKLPHCASRAIFADRATLYPCGQAWDTFRREHAEAATHLPQLARCWVAIGRVEDCYDRVHLLAVMHLPDCVTASLTRRALVAQFKAELPELVYHVNANQLRIVRTVCTLHPLA